MESWNCVICNTAKNIDIFYNNYREYTQCNFKRNLKRYCENKYELSNQRKIFFERNRDVLFAKSKLNQQNRKYEKKIDKQQIEELNKRLEELTQGIEMLKLLTHKWLRNQTKLL